MSDPMRSYKDKREQLYQQLVTEYEDRFSTSSSFHKRATQRLVDGGSHALRMFEPFPPWIRSAQGAYLYDLDCHAILDFWQGHYANVLGHNPGVVREALAEMLTQGHGLQTGSQDVQEWELADVICQHVGADRVRFTTSGTLATMYAVLLSRTFTGRDKIMKVGGGWHGGHPRGFKGVSYGREGYQGVETEGLPQVFPQEVVVTSYNDANALEDAFRKHGDEVACFIVEPFIGAGGFVAASPEYLRLARELTERHGALLVLDEIISGFRFRAGNLGALYGIQPDLMTLGKVVGGGMPVAAVAGRADVMGLCGRWGGRRVRFDGGTYSGHALSMLAGRTLVEHLAAHEDEIYPRIQAMGERLRAAVQRAYDDEGVLVQVLGGPSEVMPGSSMILLNFLHQAGVSRDLPDELNNPQNSDGVLREREVKVAYLLEDVFVLHGGGAVSAAHTEEDLALMEEASRKVARRLREAGLAGPHR